MFDEVIVIEVLFSGIITLFNMFSTFLTISILLVSESFAPKFDTVCITLATMFVEIWNRKENESKQK